MHGEMGENVNLHRKIFEPHMSALGQKQTFAVQNGMSVFPPIADIR